MSLTCPKCSRLNPEDALYCHDDGQALRAYQAPATSNRLARPFVFPSGRACNTFDELVAACQDDWMTARDFLQSGLFSSYFGGMGRIDLGQAARDAAKNPDADRGLDQLLSRLPADSAVGARLTAAPLEIDLGALEPGQDSDFEVRIKNAGRGLLHGSLSCGAYWLQAGNAPGQKEKLFQTLDEIVVPLHVRGKALRASHKPLECQIAIESNGGTATVTVRLRVPVKPFRDGPFAGAATPRQLAMQAKVHSKEAIPFFENGAVARWYQSNGWSYPVQGPTAHGLGAVQQFFEALGLTPPPKVEISQRALALQGQSGEQLQHSVQVSTQERRPVYAHAVSDQPWLHVGKVKMSGRTADIPLTVSVPDQPGDSLEASLTVTSNGNQKFTVPVRLSVAAGSPRVIFPPVPAAVALPVAIPVAASFQPALAATLPYSIPPAPLAVPMNSITPAARPMPLPEVIPVLEAGEEPSPSGQPRGPARWLPFAPVAFIALGLLGTVVRDALVKPPPPDKVGDGSGFVEEPMRAGKERLLLAFHDEEIGVSLGQGGQKSNITGEMNRRRALWEPSMRFGLQMLGEGGQENKRLTFFPNGMTHNCCVRIGGKELLWGEAPFKLVEGGDTVGEKFGRWRERDIKLGKDRFGRERKGRKSSWVFDSDKIVVTQHVEVIVGHSGDLDTCLVQYRIDNEDDADHEVGLRFLLDTFIGNNDGVPFLIPGQEQLINTTFEFNKASEVPDFLQARESEDLARPGTVAQLGLKLEGVEHPDRVTLGAYPNPDLRAIDQRCNQEKTKWDVPVLSIQTAKPADSAVTIYWDPKLLRKGESRTVGFTYGLGYLAGGEGGGKLALTAGGSFTPSGEITVTAYVGNPQPGQKVMLNLPDGFEMLSDEKSVLVPQPGEASRTSPVSWKIKAPRKTGDFKLEAETSSGLKQTLTITLRPKRIFGS